MKFLVSLVVLLCAASAFATPTKAHPHVWVNVTSHIIYDSKGEATGIRQTWKFDDIYSTYALQGVTQKTKGVFTREELAPLAETNMADLKDSDYFTFVKVSGKKVKFGNPMDYWLDYKDEMLTLNFTLPFKTPQKTKNLSIQIYDSTYFIDFGLAEKDAVVLVDAPGQCKTVIQKPKGVGFGGGQQMTSDDLGQVYASKIAVTCP
jgi:ABC-type uncharacterized transport system substrate-binding protein